eukprot:s321_g22.t2
MLATSEIVKAVAACLKASQPFGSCLVVDPVMVSTSGHTLLEDDAIQSLKDELFPCATLITPNLPEARLLLGVKDIESVAAMETAARQLAAMGPRWADQIASFADTVGKDLRASHIDIANGAEKSCAHWKAVQASEMANYATMSYCAPDSSTLCKALCDQSSRGGPSGMAHRNLHHNEKVEELEVRHEWAGFDLLKVGGEKLVFWKEGGLVVLSGCITTTSPMKQKSDFDITVAEVPPSCAPERFTPFIAPTAMSRYEGIRQCGTSTTLRPDGRLVINFNKHLNPMVLHFSGFAYSMGEPEGLIQMIQPDKSSKAETQRPSRLQPMHDDEPAAQLDGTIVTLQGRLMEATYGFTSQIIGILPERCRPQREIRCLAPLLRKSKDEDMGQCDLADQSIALTLKTDGKITVHGGNVHLVDQKGNMRILPQKKRGILSLDGIHFYVGNDTAPVEVSNSLQKSDDQQITDEKKKEILQIFAPQVRNTAVACRQGSIVLLEGSLNWVSSRPLNTKQAIATLPKGFWPRRRETFFTRGRQEERRRVDIDVFGRIFCPEGADRGSDGGGYVDLSGVIFIRTTSPPKGKPLDPEYDELRLQYNRTVVDVASSSFKGHELLEKFIRRCNAYEWKLLHHTMAAQAGRRMMTPGVGRLDEEVPTRGWDRGNEFNLSKREDRLWNNVLRAPLLEHYGISTFHTLLHLSCPMLDEVLNCVRGLSDEDRRHIKGLKRSREGDWERTRQPRLTFQCLQELACEISDQMFDHWDFYAQMQGLLKNDFRAPKTIEHLFPRRLNRWQEKLIKDNVPEKDFSKFEEIRQFFFLYETTGSNMTHCSLMGSQDLFTTTGKWYFPDAEDVQQQLFESIGWLFDRNIYHYISERQTAFFPFIEDFDIQANVDWKEPLPGQIRPDPPDELIMIKPLVDADGKVYGDPGTMMKYRAQAIHMIYPHIEDLYCLVYSASGYNKGKELLKSSFHLVWPQLVVDPDRAPVIRYVTLGIFKNETNKEGSELNQLQKRLMELHDGNEWELVFDSTTINARNGLRLPYSDKASMIVKDPEDREKIKRGELSKNSAFKVRVTEERPSRPVGRIEFKFEKNENDIDVLVDAKWVANEKSYEKCEWIKMGSCRRDQSSAQATEVTPWQLGPDVMSMLPKRPGERYYREYEDDQGTFTTHVPYSNIVKCTLTPAEFARNWDDKLSEELEALAQEQEFDLRKRIAGQWVCITDEQAIWRAPASQQFADKFADWDWGARTGKLARPAELIYIHKKGKVLLDGPDDVTAPLLRVLNDCKTEPDDFAIMPVYDKTKMERFP